jgi:membrane protease subunit HflK
MSWDDQNNRDPWGRRGDDGPPDLEEMVRRMQDKLNRLLNFGKAGSRGTGGNSVVYLPLLLLFAVFVLLMECAYVIQPGERGVVLRFGRHVATLTPGLSLRLPRPIERVEKVNADLVQSITHKAAMLTRDENIVDIELEVQYKVRENEVDRYLFNVRGPEGTLRQATEASVREIIGGNTMDFILTDGRNQIAQSTRETLQRILDEYQCGLTVNAVNIKSAKPPDEVKAAFDDAIKAREDEQRLINEAEAYKNDILPKARGAAARAQADAEAYKARVTAQAEGDSSRFTQLLDQYRRAPEVTRQRLYLDAMESVLGNISKVIVNDSTARPLLYLPLEKSSGTSETPAVVPPVVAPEGTNETVEPPATTGEPRPRNDNREREAR